jgi:hypothetical protein
MVGNHRESTVLFRTISLSICLFLASPVSAQSVTYIFVADMGTASGLLEFSSPPASDSSPWNTSDPAHIITFEFEISGELQGLPITLTPEDFSDPYQLFIQQAVASADGGDLDSGSMFYEIELVVDEPVIWFSFHSLPGEDTIQFANSFGAIEASGDWVLQTHDLPLLTVGATGAGDGTINSSPAGISCGVDCEAEFPADTIVTLAAVPDWGSEFAGWAGDADCEDGEVTMVADLSCSAAFVPCSIVEEVTLTGADIADDQLHQACNRLVVGPYVSIADSGNGRFRAGNAIEFGSNFDINTGGQMSAVLGPPCGVDPTPPGGACPGECTGGCDSDTCFIDCTSSYSCQSQTLACPQGFNCEIDCGQGACADSIVDCPDVYGCYVSCSGTDACDNAIVNCSSFGSCGLLCDPGVGACDGALLACGNDSCSASCAGPGEPEVACGDSCKCEGDC